MTTPPQPIIKSSLIMNLSLSKHIHLQYINYYICYYKITMGYINFFGIIIFFITMFFFNIVLKISLFILGFGIVLLCSSSSCFFFLSSSSSSFSCCCSSFQFLGYIFPSFFNVQFLCYMKYHIFVLVESQTGVNSGKNSVKIIEKKHFFIFLKHSGKVS